MRRVLHLDAEIQALCGVAADAVRAFLAREDLRAKVLCLEHVWLAEMLVLGGDTLGVVLTGDLREAREWVPHLRACIAQDMARGVFDQVWGFARGKVECGREKVVLLCRVMEGIDGLVVGADQGVLNALGERLRCAVEGVGVRGEACPDRFVGLEPSIGVPWAVERHGMGFSPVAGDVEVSPRCELFAIPSSANTISQCVNPGSTSMPLRDFTGGAYPKCDFRNGPSSQNMRARNWKRLSVSVFPPPQSENLPLISDRYSLI